WSPCELDAGDDDALQGTHQSRWPDQSRVAMGHERHDLPPRDQQRWTSLGAGPNLARAESDQVCEKLPHADLAVSWRERFPCAAESDARELERPATTADPKPPDRLARRESLDTERREQPLLLPGSPWVAEEVFGRGSHERDVGFSPVASVSGPLWNLAAVRGGITLCLCVSVVNRSFHHRDTEAQS